MSVDSWLQARTVMGLGVPGDRLVLNACCDNPNLQFHVDANPMDREQIAVGCCAHCKATARVDQWNAKYPPPAIEPTTFMVEIPKGAAVVACGEWLVIAHPEHPAQAVHLPSGKVSVL